MCADAETRKTPLSNITNTETEPCSKSKMIPVTLPWRFPAHNQSRRTPALLQCPKGDMNLVGVRHSGQNDNYETEHWCRISIKPGVTENWEVID